MMTKRDALEQWEVAVSAAVCEGEYTSVRRMPNGQRCALLQMVYTHALVVDISLDGYGRRYCFEHRKDAEESLQAWSGEGHPGGPWIVCKGLGVNLLNPAFLAA